MSEATLLSVSDGLDTMQAKISRLDMITGDLSEEIIGNQRAALLVDISSDYIEAIKCLSGALCNQVREITHKLSDIKTVI